MNITSHSPHLHWFAVRVTYSRELALKAFLDEEKIENFIPMRRDYIVKKGRRIRRLVPDSQMRSFILVAGTYEESIVYVEPAELQLIKGQKVRVIGGVFEGAVGEFVRIRRDRRVVVNIEGVMAVATTFIHSSLVEPIAD